MPPRGNGKQCSICTHPRRAQMERAWLVDGISRRVTAEEFQVSPRQLVNHYDRGHVKRDVKAALERRDASTDKRAGLPILNSLDEYRARIDGALGKLDKLLEETSNSDPGVILATIREQMSAIREATRLLELTGKLTGELDTAKYNLFIMPAWTQTRNAILEALDDFPEVRAIVLQRLRAKIASKHQESAFAALPAPDREAIESTAVEVIVNGEPVDG